jgi:hypothetical protein
MVAERAFRVVVALGLVVALAAGLAASDCGNTGVRRIASAEDLLADPAGVLEEEAVSSNALYAVSLPASPLVVILRPLPREEYNSYQVRAVSYDMIEREMLAAAVVLPVLELGDIAALPASLIVFLRGAVNDLSGYQVFPPADPTG